MLPDSGLEPRDSGLSRTDPGCHLGLGKSGGGAGLQDLVQKLEFLSERVIFAAHVCACKRPGFESFKRIPHLSPFYARSRDLECFPWGLLRLLDELMQHHDPSSDERAVEHSNDTFRHLEPEFEKPLTHSPGVRHSEVGAVKFLRSAYRKKRATKSAGN
jgi:hypothetical protein